MDPTLIKPGRKYLTNDFKIVEVIDISDVNGKLVGFREVTELPYSVEYQSLSLRLFAQWCLNEIGGSGG